MPSHTTVTLEMSAEKRKVMFAGKSENVNGIVGNVMVGDERLEQAKNLKYVGSTLFDDGKSGKEVWIRVGIASHKCSSETGSHLKVKECLNEE